MTKLGMLEQVADWADLRGVDYSVYRDGAEWTVQLKFSDAKGTFLEFFPLPESSSGTLEKKLDDLCRKARKSRIQALSYGKAA